MNTLTQYILTHHALISYSTALFFIVLNTAIKIALYFHPVADWVKIAEKSPRLAALIRLSMAIGINPVSVLQSVIDLVRGEASNGTLASVKAVGVSASKPLISPRMSKLNGFSSSEAPTNPEIKT